MSESFNVICLLFKYFETDMVLLEDQFVPNKLKIFNCQFTLTDGQNTKKKKTRI